MTHANQIRKERYEVIQKRREAAVVLDNPELLYMYSLVRCDVRPFLFIEIYFDSSGLGLQKIIV